MTINILNQNGENTGRSVELPSSIFGIEPNEHVLYLAVKQYLAHQRQGTHKTKERSEKAGSTRKLKKQKGTGGARAGDANSPTIRGGGRAFGPRPRTYTIKLNKKVKSLARRSALAVKAGKGQVIVVEDFAFETPRTKDYLAFLSAVNANTKPLHLTATVDDHLRSAILLPVDARQRIMKKDGFTSGRLPKKTLLARGSRAIDNNM